MNITSKKITTENFMKYGKVVMLPERRPTSQAPDYKFWSDIASYNIDGETEIGLCRVYKQPFNEICGMERHLKTPEILIPVDAPFILPLLKESDDESCSEAFLVNPGEAVVINKAVWHGACLPVEKDEATYFVIFKRNTPFDDVEKKQIRSIMIDEKKP